MFGFIDQKEQKLLHEAAKNWNAWQLAKKLIKDDLPSGYSFELFLDGSSDYTHMHILDVKGNVISVLKDCQTGNQCLEFIQDSLKKIKS